jgi:methylated-DNA-[protein]-cysteine S-methyltransferase
MRMNRQYVSRYDREHVHLLIADDGCGICGVWFEGAVHYGKDLRSDAEEKETERIRRTRHWLDLYFGGTQPDFDIPLHLQGTPFQQAVWHELLKIPYGECRTYGDIAAALGKPKAAQAVGQAVGANPVSILVPCHRVIGKDGSLTGYDGGIDNKILLLRLEGSLK